MPASAVFHYFSIIIDTSSQDMTNKPCSIAAWLLQYAQFTPRLLAISAKHSIF